MKKLFISQPMAGKTDEEILKERNDIIRIAEEKVGEKLELIDSFIENAPEDTKPLWYLGKSLEFMSQADAVAFAKDFAKYRGCKIEHTCALEYKVPVIIYCSENNHFN